VSFASGTASLTSLMPGTPSDAEFVPEASPTPLP